MLGLIQNAIQDFINNLDVDDNVKKELSLISPSNYTWNLTYLNISLFF